MSEKKPRKPSKKRIQALIKKEGKIRAAYILNKEHGMAPADIAEAFSITRRTVHAYIWRVGNPEKFNALLKKYYERKRQKKEVEEMKSMAAEVEGK